MFFIWNLTIWVIILLQVNILWSTPWSLSSKDYLIHYSNLLFLTSQFQPISTMMARSELFVLWFSPPTGSTIKYKRYQHNTWTFNQEIFWKCNKQPLKNNQGLCLVMRIAHISHLGVKNTNFPQFQELYTCNKIGRFWCVYFFQQACFFFPFQHRLPFWIISLYCKLESYNASLWLN